MKEYIAEELEDLKTIASELLSNFPKNKIFAFFGKMGSGKTTFIKEICKQLGVSDVVTSPTFALINEYTLPEEHKIFHFDFYRIESIEEAYDFGYEEYFYSGEYCFIEWPELIETLLPKKYIKIIINEVDNGNRIFSFENKIIS
jgi:tRNA threonylcarbamoyladenosine biosynthesis protein TsaE